jgi:ketosteroid isomerase-like protein
VNAEIVRQAYGCEFDRRRPESLRPPLVAFLSRLDPQIRFEPDSHEPTAQVIRGREGVREVLESALEEWEACRYELSQVKDLDDQRVFVCGTVHARARGSGAGVALPFANVWTLRAGKAVRIEAYGDGAEALAALEPVLAKAGSS